MFKNMGKFYKYIGSHDIQNTVAHSPAGCQIKSVNDVEKWIVQTRQKPNAWGVISATFIVDSEGYLCIADRHSEHIACSGGKVVLSAGEIFFVRGEQGLEVAEVSNQSTGFCPESESWPLVAKALDQIPLPHPGKFTIEFVFRRCPTCGQLNIVKDNLFLCAVCNTDLPTIWNCIS